MARFSSAVLFTTGNLPANVNALVATTLPKVSADIADNFFEATPFFWWMREKNRVMPYDGGDTIEHPIMFDENPNGKAYEPYEVMDVTPPQGIGTTVWKMCHYRIPIMYTRTTAAANKGQAAVVNLITALKEQAQLSIVKTINDDLFSESTQEIKRINRLSQMIEENTAASQTNVVGGISKSTYSWWRNQYKALTTTTGAITEAVREMSIQCGNGSDTPDLALCDDYTYLNLENKLSTSVRFVNPRAIDFGFENMTYKGMTIMYDKTIPDDGANSDGDGSMYFINTKYLKLVIGSDANFRVLPPEYDKWQDAYVGTILVDIQAICTNMKRQGVIVGGASSG